MASPGHGICAIKPGSIRAIWAFCDTKVVPRKLAIKPSAYAGLLLLLGDLPFGSAQDHGGEPKLTFASP
jgi:hypothetical protein